MMGGRLRLEEVLSLGRLAAAAMHDTPQMLVPAMCTYCPLKLLRGVSGDFSR